MSENLSKTAWKLERAATLIDIARDMLPEGHPYAEPDLYVIRLTLAKLQGELAAKATRLIIDTEDEITSRYNRQDC